MRNKLLFLSVLLALCYLPACKTVESNPNIAIINLTEMEPDTVNISQFTTGMQVVKLETNDDCLLHQISRIKLAGAFIYIQDAIFQGIYVFDQNGKFRNKLYKEGRGPGEYLSIYDFTVDEQQNTLEIFDGMNHKLFIYGLPDFHLIKEIPIPVPVASRFEKKDGIYYFGTSGLRNIVNDEKTNSDIIAFDPETGETTPLFDRLLPDEVNRVWSISGFSANKHGQLFFSKAWQDRFYRIEKRSATPFLMVDAGRHGIPDAIKKGTYEEQEVYMNTGSAKNQYLFFRLSYYEKDKVIISFTQGTDPYNLHYYIQMDEQEYLVNRFINDFISTQPYLELQTLRIIENTFASILIPEQKSSSEMEQYLKSLGVQAEDNPVILLFNLK